MKRLINVSMILVLMLGFLPPTSAVAEVIPLWEQLPNGVFGSVYSDPTSIIADDFYLPAASSIGQIEFWSDLKGPVAINYDIYQTTTDTNGYDIPGVVLRSGSVTSTGTPEDSEICSNPSNCGYRHNINSDTSLDLAVGHYWFSIYSAESFTWSRANIPIEFQTFAFKTVGTWKGQYTTYAFAFRLLEP